MSESAVAIERDIVRAWTPGEAGRWLDDAEACVKRHGVVVVPDAIPAAVVAAVLKHVKVRHAEHMAPGQKKLFRRFQSDPLRAQLPFAVDGPVADPRFFAPPAVLALARRLLGDDFVVGEMGIVISHPGAGPQEIHRDSAFLFGGRPEEASLPPFSLSVLVPLMDVGLDTGPTEFWPGSHVVADEAAAAAAEPVRMPLKAGTISIHDARLLHRGGANVSGPVRPAMYIDFCRDWYRERSGYEEKPQVRVTPAMLGRLPEAYRPLFAWALHLNRTDGFQEFVYRWVGRIRRRVLSLRGR